MPELKLTETQLLVYQMYKDEKGQPILLTPAQDYLFSQIAKKLHPRLHTMCHTRFGKSMTVALAVLTRCSTYPEKWAIIAGEKEKAKIIMGYIIQHIFDNSFTASRFVPDKGESPDEIRRHKNKNHLTFVVNPWEKDQTKRLLSEIFIGSAKDALGFGAPNVIEDEAGVIPDLEHELVMRMLGDNPTENFLCKVGNPFNRNHFLKSFFDPSFKKVVIDCYRSLKDGRMSQKVIDENKDNITYPVLYECKFPPEDAIDEAGYQHLILTGDLEIAQARKVEPMGRRRLGVDVARGGRNFNCWVLRGENYARILLKSREESTVKVAEQTALFMRDYGIDARDTFVDDTGVGHGVVSVLKEMGLKVQAVNNANAAYKSSQYINVRAESYAGDKGVAVWIKQGAYLEPSDDWDELLKIRYRKQPSTLRTQIESKDDMRKRGIESPDVADSLALTFAKVYTSNYSNNNLNPSAVIGGLSQTDQPERPWGGVERFIPGVG